MELSQVANGTVTDPRKYTTLIYGEPGVGKTSWAAQIPGAYFVKAEEGHKGVSVFGSPCGSWDTFLDFCVEIQKGIETGWAGQREIKTVVIDVLDRLYDQLDVWLCEHKTFVVKGVGQKYESIRHVPYGQGFVEANKELLRVLNKVVALGLGLVLICHERVRTIKWRGEELPKPEPDLVPSAVDAVTGYCDAIGHFTVEEKVEKQGLEVIRAETGRWQWWQPSFLRIAKHRLRGFPEKLPLAVDVGYETYRCAFEEAVKGAKQNGR